MTQESKKVSRRQAIKLITAATGAATLANLPNQWVKPVLQAGVLPAHAQTSPTATATSTSTSTPTNTPTSTPTNTPTSTPTNTPTATATRIQYTLIDATIAHDNPQIPPGDFYSDMTLLLSATISPAAAGIQIQRTVSVGDNSHPDDVQTGTTDSAGVVNGPNFDLTSWSSPYIGGQDVTVLWEFADPNDGTNSISLTVRIIE